MNIYNLKIRTTFGAILVDQTFFAKNDTQANQVRLNYLESFTGMKDVSYVLEQIQIPTADELLNT